MGTQRAFSLLEVMVTLAILAVVASLAVPSLLPQVQKAQLATSVDAIAAFAVAARDDAMSQRRCTRLRIVDDDVLVAEVKNALSCEEVQDADVPAAALLIADRPAWIELRRLKLESPRLQARFLHPPGPFAAARQLRFRPTGRVWANDTFVDDDHALIEILHPVLGETRQVLVRSNGFICVPPLGHIAPGDPPITYRCGGSP